MRTAAGRSKGLLGDRQGAAAAIIVLTVVVLLGMTALAVDLGMLLAGRTEAQRAADAGALSGALSLYESPKDDARAKEKAIETAALNPVRGTSTDVLLKDVEVDLAQALVRVKVIRSSGRGNALSNFFARVLGINTSNVSAIAAAHMAVAKGVECPLPFAIVDRWWESDTGGLAVPTDEWDESDGDIYNEGPLPDLPGSSSKPTGYGVPDRGTILKIYPGDPSGTPLPGWAYLLELDDPGGSEVRYWIHSCGEPGEPFEYGDNIEIKNGMTTGPVGQGIDSLIAKDPTAYWGTGPNAPSGGCVFRPGAVDENGEMVCVTTPRVRAAILIRPEDAPSKPGNTTVPIENFVGVFVICAGQLNVDEASCKGNVNSKGGGVHVRFVDYRGVSALGPGQHGGSLVRVLQLVQ